jgi:hypothetical protein
VRSSILASTALLLGLFAFGCSSSTPPAEAAATSDLAGSACATVQHVAYATDGQVDAAMAAFRTRNPGTWDIDRNGVDGVLTAIRVARRTDRAPAAQLPANAEAIARAFMQKNQDLLHFTSEGMAQTEFLVSTFEGPSVVTLAYSGVRAGMEAYGVSIFDIIHLSLWLADDGSVVRVESFSSTHPDQIDLCTQPPNAPIVSAIIGTDLVYHPLEFVPVTPPTPVGRVEARDIDLAKAEPVIAGGDSDDHGFDLVVAWRVPVKRGGFDWSFTVEATTGKVLQVEQGF